MEADRGKELSDNEFQVLVEESEKSTMKWRRRAVTVSLVGFLGINLFFNVFQHFVVDPSSGPATFTDMFGPFARGKVDLGVGPGEAAVVVTTLAVFIVTLNVAAIAVTLNRQVTESATYSISRWIQTSQEAAQLAAVLAGVTSLTQIASHPGLALLLVAIAFFAIMAAEMTIGEAARRTTLREDFHKARASHVRTSKAEERFRRTLRPGARIYLSKKEGTPRTYAWRIALLTGSMGLSFAIYLGVGSFFQAQEFCGNGSSGCVTPLWAGAYFFLFGLIMAGIPLAALSFMPWLSILKARQAWYARILRIALWVFLVLWSVAVLMSYLRVPAVYLFVIGLQLLFIGLWLYAVHTGRGIANPLQLYALTRLRLDRQLAEHRESAAAEKYRNSIEPESSSQQATDVTNVWVRMMQGLKALFTADSE